MWTVTGAAEPRQGEIRTPLSSSESRFPSEQGKAKPAQLLLSAFAL